MNLSMKWLNDYVKADMPIKEFAAEMTMSGSKVETYEEMLETAAADTAIAEAEAEYAGDGKLYDAREALASLRRKHFG